MSSHGIVNGGDEDEVSFHFEAEDNAYDGYQAYPEDETMPKIFEYVRLDDLKEALERLRVCLQDGESFRQLYRKQTILMYFMDWQRTSSPEDSIAILRFFVEICELNPLVQIDNLSAFSIAMEVRRVDWLRYLRRKCTGDVNLHVTQKMLSALMIEDYMAMVTYLIESCDLHEDWIGYCLMEEVVSILKVNVDPKHHHHPLWDYMLFSSRQWQSSALKKGALHYCDALSCKQLPRLEDCHSLAEMFAEVKRWRLTLNIH